MREPQTAAGREFLRSYEGAGDFERLEAAVLAIEAETTDVLRRRWFGDTVEVATGGVPEATSTPLEGKRLDWVEHTEEHVTSARWLCNCAQWHPAHDGADPVRAGAERLADDMELLCRTIVDEAPNGGAQINRAFHAETGYWPADSSMAFRDQVLGDSDGA